MSICKAGIVGAGAMGAGIALCISASRFPVVLKDVDSAMVEKGLSAIRAIYQGRVNKGQMSAGEMQEKMGLISGTATYNDFRDVDIVIEAVPERIDIKRQVFSTLAEVCPEHAILASNTSGLSISEIATATSRPGKVIGMHFFNPAHVMKLVEIIPGLDTFPETVDDALLFAQSLHKVPVVVQECPGFLVNRLLMPYLNEAAMALGEGAATAGEIDSVMAGLGWPMGPFTLMDMLGIDVCYDVLAHLHREYGERMAPAPLFALLCEAGRYGEKADAGFYGYGGQSDTPVRRMIAQLQADGKARTDTRFSSDRLMMRMLNEAVLCVTEHIAGIKDIDLACIAGLGMKCGDEPIGPLQMADEIGLDVVLAKAEALQSEFGERFRPAPLLRTKVRAGHLGRQAGRGFREYRG